MMIFDRSILCGIAILFLLTGCGSSGDDDEESVPIVESNIGNDVEFTGETNVGFGFLLGSPINVSESSTLKRLALITKPPITGANVKMALYSADGGGGAPGTLVAETASTSISAVGVLEIPVLTEVALPAGDYVIMAAYEPSEIIGREDSAGSVVYYRSFTYSDPLPDPFGTAIVYTDEIFNYYMVVDNR